MITVDSLIKLLYCSFPVFVIFLVIFLVIVKISKEKSISFDYTPDKLYGMRSPTDEEAVNIKAQIFPRLLKPVIVISLILLPLAAMPTVTAFYLISSNGIAPAVVMGFIALSLVFIYIGVISQPLSDILSLYKKRYSVSECYFSDVRSFIRVNYRGIPCRITHAVIKDQIGSCWESDLTKDLFNVTVGTSCLVIIFDAEDKVNRARHTGKPLYRRAIYVPRDELCL